ncbi:hypothetical protein O1611_g2110 [Lasiodiplodia mahajangana]|uniref:Uncharacterized protein n=1 Tax=Lasiodiplodia mahajangana TaxID=1108764 RepID=A0ACC2JVG3_9PEZI|nr:hypothetical protein O1611_g2110 [Lasiodiplodia mahajangana]
MWSCMGEISGGGDELDTNANFETGLVKVRDVLLKRMRRKPEQTGMGTLAAGENGQPATTRLLATWQLLHIELSKARPAPYHRSRTGLIDGPRHLNFMVFLHPM